MSMIFREAVTADIPQIQFVRNAVKENMLSDPALVPDKDCEEFMTVRGKGWVCKAGEKIVGFAIADLKENNIWALFVLPEYENRGIAKRLHALMLDWYFSQGKDSVWLGTAFNTRAEEFYRRQGWKDAGLHGTKEIKFEMSRDQWSQKNIKHPKRNFFVFINPVSGTKKKEGIRTLLEKTLNEHAWPFRVLPTERSGDYSFLPEIITNENITDVIICGGDGTVNQVTSFLRHTNVNAGIIPMGSGNGLASAAGIKKNPKHALDVIIRGKSSFIDAFFINDRYSCQISGLGFDAQVAHDFAKQKKRGLKTYIRQTVKHFFKAKSYPFTITTGKEKFSTDAFFISIANANQFGNNFTIAPRASLHDGLLDIVVVNGGARLKLLRKVLQHVSKGELSNSFNAKQTIQYFQTDALQISNPDLAPLHIDGEPAETAAHFDIKILRSAFRLLQP